MEFVQELSAGRVVFGPGRRQALADEVARLGAARALLVAGRGRPVADELGDALGDLLAGRVDEVVVHVPADVAARAVAAARWVHADVVVAVGGGSAIGTAKAIAKETHLPVVAVPTTYSGSEMTPIWGLTGDRRKVTGRDPAVLPRTVIYDPELTLSLPPAVSAASGMNALAHLVEAAYSPDVSPVVTASVRAGVTALAGWLPQVVREPGDLEARTQAMYGAWLGGWVLGTTATGVHHKVCHVLGGGHDLPHAPTHSALLPYAIAANTAAAPAAVRTIEQALRDAGRDVDHAAGALWDLRREIGAPGDLASLGLAAADLDDVATRVIEEQPLNPRPLAEAWVRDLLDAALTGARPGARLG